MLFVCLLTLNIEKHNSSVNCTDFVAADDFVSCYKIHSFYSPMKPGWRRVGTNKRLTTAETISYCRAKGMITFIIDSSFDCFFYYTVIFKTISFKTQRYSI